MNNVLAAGALGDLPMRDFLVSPGFAGVVALLAAVVAAGAVWFAVRRAGQRSQRQLEQREHDLAQSRADAEHAQAVARCWARWQWVVETAGIEPAVSEGATLGLGPAVTLELLRGLLGDAEALGDETLAKAIAVYREQLLLVLAQQGGPVAELAKPPRPTAVKPPPVESGHVPGDEPPAAVKASGGGRRRR